MILVSLLNLKFATACAAQPCELQVRDTSIDELADIILLCWKQPHRICVHDIVVMPTTSSFA
jgi:hypothetical protein